MSTEFGKYLRSVRIKRHKKLKDLALATNKSISYICDLELGRRGASKLDPVFLFTLADYLNIPINEFLVRTGAIDRSIDAEYQDYYKIMRSKIRAQRVGGHIRDALDDVKALKMLVSSHEKGLSEVLFSLENHILELKSTLTHG